MLTMEETRISLDVGHSAVCNDFAAPLFLQLSRGAYDRCSVMAIPESVERWREEHRTARKRADRARRLGYHGGTWPRVGFEDDVYEINTSLETRQGRPMSAAYRVRPSFNDPDYPCARHGVHYYGVRTDEGEGRLVAYLWVYRAGDLALVSSILGHADHLENDIMYPLFEAALSGEIENGPGTMVYNRHDSGTDGLRYFKERLGFRADDVVWLP